MHRGLLLNLLVWCAVGAGLTGPVAAQSRPGPPIIPPSTDFSAFARKYPWQLTPAQIADATRKQAPNNFDEAKIVPYTLPDLFTGAHGTKVTTAAEWQAQRRPELLRLFQREMYGVPPPPPADLQFRVLETDPRALLGAATLKRVEVRFTLQGAPFAFHVLLLVPNDRRGPAPVFLLLNHRSPENTDVSRKIRSEFWPAEYVVSRGYALAAINVAAEVEPDQKDATTGLRAFYRAHSEHPEELTWGALSAWAWSGSRALDYFATDPDLHAAQVAVIGHSRGGKTALLAAAQDPRFALACVNNAGEGGPALTRRNYGETLGQITRNFPHWFAPTYAGYAARPEELPFDQHALIALVAPRGYHGGDATQDLHADPRGSWLALAAAAPAWGWYGQARPLPAEMPAVNDLLVAGPLAYHLREGGHALTTFDWKLYLDHADALWRRPQVPAR